MASRPARGRRNQRILALAGNVRNRFYIGEIAYKGEVHKGEHEAIVDREVFEAVQTRIQMHSVARKIRRASAPALLTGRIFDDAGYPMSPSHTNKQGVIEGFGAGRQSGGIGDARVGA